MSNQIQQHSAFTTYCKQLVPFLKNDVIIKKDEKEKKGIALWDTGANSSCISEDVVKALSLVPTGKKRILTPAGEKEVSTFLIDVILPNNVIIPNLAVCDSDIGDQHLDILIGMDIILLGDFAVSNYSNKTVFSFRLPSKQTTDYVKQIQKDNKIGQKHGKGKRKKKR